VQEHAAEERKNLVGTELLDENFWHQPKISQKYAQSLVAKRNFEEENKHIDRNDQVSDERNGA
jgi:hypothetical protein